MAEHPLILILCRDLNEGEDEYHRIATDAEHVRLSVSASGDLIVSDDGEPVAQIANEDGRWWFHTDGRLPVYRNFGSPVTSVALNFGDILTVEGSSSFLTVHPSDLPAEPGSDAPDAGYQLKELQNPDSHTAELKLFEKYYPRIKDIAAITLQTERRRVFDEEDVASEAMSEFYQALAEGRFSDVGGESEMWARLVSMTRMHAYEKVQSLAASQGPAVRGESVFQADAGITAVSHRQGIGKPESLLNPQALEDADEVGHFLDFLDAYDSTMPLRQIAELRMEGLTNRQIASRVHSSLRSVERLTAKVRVLWDQHARRSS